MLHTFTVRDSRYGVVSLQVKASTREAAAAWIDRNPHLTIVATFSKP